MEAHSGVDDASGLVHHVEGTAANVSDVTQAHKLLHGKEDAVFGDSGRTGIGKREQKRACGLERLKAGVRAEVEHPFRVIERQCGYGKGRYRGIVKNAAQVPTLFALSNLWMWVGGCCRRRDKCARWTGEPVRQRKKREIPTELMQFRASSREIARVRQVVQTFLRQVRQAEDACLPIAVTIASTIRRPRTLVERTSTVLLSVRRTCHSSPRPSRIVISLA